MFCAVFLGVACDATDVDVAVDADAELTAVLNLFNAIWQRFSSLFSDFFAQLILLFFYL